MALCKICGTKDESLFYSSVLTYCKEHWKEKVRKNRVEKIEQYRAFDKMRASMPHRVKARKEYAKTEIGKEAHKRANANWFSKNPERKRASTLVSKAVRSGKIKKLPCFVCGDDVVEAHHPDYSNPLSVIWLCVDHNKDIHWHMEEVA